MATSCAVCHGHTIADRESGVTPSDPGLRWPCRQRGRREAATARAPARAPPRGVLVPGRVPQQRRDLVEGSAQRAIRSRWALPSPGDGPPSPSNGMSKLRERRRDVGSDLLRGPARADVTAAGPACNPHCTLAVTVALPLSVNAQVLVLLPLLEQAPDQMASRPLVTLRVICVPGANGAAAHRTVRRRCRAGTARARRYRSGATAPQSRCRRLSSGACKS